jgi:hypothetical protein
MLIVKIALAILEFSLALFALFSEQIKKPYGLIFSALLFLQFFVTLLEVYFEKEEAKKSATSGQLNPTDKFSEFGKFGYEYDPSRPLNIRWGNSETFFVVDFHRWLGPEGAGDPSIPRSILYPVNGEEEYKIYVWLENGQIRLRMKLFNRRNQLVAEIDGNRWNVKREYLYDLNYDSEAIEVRNDEGNVQLQVVLYKDLVQLSFFNFSPLGGVAMGKGSHGGLNVYNFGLNEPSPLLIEPMFKYPSCEFQGVRR